MVPQVMCHHCMGRNYRQTTSARILYQCFVVLYFFQLDHYNFQQSSIGWNQECVFHHAKLPGGLELNGRELYDDALRELDDLKQRMSSEYELPPLDFIG